MSRYARGRSRSKSRSNTPRPLSSRVLEDDDLEEKHQVFKGPDEGTKKIFDIKELKKITVNIIRKVPQKKGQEKPKITFDPTTVAPVRRPEVLEENIPRVKIMRKGIVQKTTVIVTLGTEVSQRAPGTKTVTITNTNQNDVMLKNMRGIGILHQTEAEEGPGVKIGIGADLVPMVVGIGGAGHITHDQILVLALTQDLAPILTIEGPDPDHMDVDDRVHMRGGEDQDQRKELGRLLRKGNISR